MLQKLNSLYIQMCNFEEREIFFLEPEKHIIILGILVL